MLRMSLTVNQKTNKVRQARSNRLCVCVVCRPSPGVCDLKQVHWMTAHRAWHVYRRAEDVELTKRCHAHLHGTRARR